MMPVPFGPYTVAHSRVVYDRSVMQLAGDEGASWESTALPLASRHEEGAVHVATGMVTLEDGSLLALHRNNAPTLLASRSNDDGETWTSPQPTELHGECGCVIQDTKGRLIAAYRSHRNAPAGAPWRTIPHIFKRYIALAILEER